MMVLGILLENHCETPPILMQGSSSLPKPVIDPGHIGLMCVLFASNYLVFVVCLAESLFCNRLSTQDSDGGGYSTNELSDLSVSVPGEACSMLLSMFLRGIFMY